MQISLSSDLLEIELTHAELHQAMQLANKDMSTVYLQNMRVALVRQLSEFNFNDPAKYAEMAAMHAYIKGQADLCRDLIQGVLNPTPVPLSSDSADSNQPVQL